MEVTFRQQSVSLNVLTLPSLGPFPLLTSPLSLPTSFTKRINELSLDESDHLLSYLFGELAVKSRRRARPLCNERASADFNPFSFHPAHINQNHDLQVRFKWKEGSLAVWDNRSTFHTGTSVFSSFPSSVSDPLRRRVLFAELVFLLSSLARLVTNDYGKEHREGNRVVSIGERPYFDPSSISRREALRDGAAGSDLA